MWSQDCKWINEYLWPWINIDLPPFVQNALLVSLQLQIREISDLLGLIDLVTLNLYWNTKRSKIFSRGYLCNTLHHMLYTDIYYQMITSEKFWKGKPNKAPSPDKKNFLIWENLPGSSVQSVDIEIKTTTQCLLCKFIWNPNKGLQ